MRSGVWCTRCWKAEGVECEALAHCPECRRELCPPCLEAHPCHPRVLPTRAELRDEFARALAGTDASFMDTEEWMRAFEGAMDKVEGRRPPTPAPRGFFETTPGQRFAAYLRKHPVPAEGQGSASAVFAAAFFVLKSGIDLSEASFVAMIREQQPSFNNVWIRDRWRSAARKVA